MKNNTDRENAGRGQGYRDRHTGFTACSATSSISEDDPRILKAFYESNMHTDCPHRVNPISPAFDQTSFSLKPGVREGKRKGQVVTGLGQWPCGPRREVKCTMWEGLFRRRPEEGGRGGTRSL